jgi:hypothetical protein
MVKRCGCHAHAGGWRQDWQWQELPWFISAVNAIDGKIGLSDSHRYAIANWNTSLRYGLNLRHLAQRKLGGEPFSRSRLSTLV